MSRPVFLEADTTGQLKAQLLRMPASVRPLGDGQRKKDVETWAIRRLLATCSEAAGGGVPSLFRFPMRVLGGERPDFQLVSPLGTVGIEVTQAVPKSLAWGLDNLRKESEKLDSRQAGESSEPAGGPIAYPEFDPEEVLDKHEAMHRANLIRSNQVRLLPDDASTCEIWVKAIVSRISAKNERFTDSGSNRNVLLIDDQWPSPLLVEEWAFPRLGRRMAALGVVFDDVFVDRERSGNTLRLGREGDIRSVTATPIWCRTSPKNKVTA